MTTNQKSGLQPENENVGMFSSPSSGGTGGQPVSGTPRMRKLSIVQLILSLLAALVLWGMALGFLSLGLHRILKTTHSLDEVTSLFMLGFSAGVVGSMLLISAWLVGRRLAERPIQKPVIWLQGLTHPVLLLVLLVMVLLLGQWVASQENVIQIILLPPLHVLAVGLPLLWFLRAGLHRLPKSGLQRQWGAFTAGLVLTPTVTFLLEMSMLLVIGLVVVMSVAFNPEWSILLDNLVRRLSHAPSPQVVLNILAPLFVRPGVVFTVFVVSAVLIPMIEEVFKPMGVWLLIKNSLTPTEGFVVGALSGVGYTFAESLAMATLPEQWLGAVVARMGTGLLHMLTAGLMGWGLARSWREGNYYRLGWMYFGVVMLHAVWNVLSVSSAFVPVYEAVPSPGKWVQQLSTISPLALVLLSVGCLTLLLLINRRLRPRHGDVRESAQ
ncbi:MAG: PrsW family glutamic-type intramembrane protease [Chloroflexota bacterium]